MSYVHGETWSLLIVRQEPDGQADAVAICWDTHEVRIQNVVLEPGWEARAKRRLESLRDDEALITPHALVSRRAPRRRR